MIRVVYPNKLKESKTDLFEEALVAKKLKTKEKAFVLDTTNEIIKGCLITHQGQIINEQIKNLKTKT